MAEYEIWLTNDTGSRLARLQPYWFQATRVVNDVGTLQMGVSPSFNPDWLARDNRIEVWREPTDGRLGLFRSYFLRAWRWDLIGSEETLRLYGRDPNYLLTSRTIAYTADLTDGKIRATEADDALKDIVDANLISDSSTPTYGSRDLSALSVDVDLTAAPAISKSLSWRPLLDCLQDAAEMSYTAGTRLYFDVVEADMSSAVVTYQFRTYTGQPGRDITDLGVAFSPEQGNLVNAFLNYDYADEINYVYGLGQGKGVDRDIQEAYDADAIAASAWNRREGIVNAADDETAAVLDKADGEVRKGRGVVRAGGDILDTPQFRFGLDWHWGDVIRARYRIAEFDALVRAVSVSVDGDKRETVTGSLELVE